MSVFLLICVFLFAVQVDSNDEDGSSEEEEHSSDTEEQESDSYEDETTEKTDERDEEEENENQIGNHKIMILENLEKKQVSNTETPPEENTTKVKQKGDVENKIARWANTDSQSYIGWNQNMIPIQANIFHPNCTCGSVSTLRIIGGVDAQEKKWCWQAMVKTQFNETHAYGCGGSIICDLYIITARHCVNQNNIDLSNIKIFLGTNKRSREDAEEYRVTEIIGHPNFEEKMYDFDLALLKLDRPILYRSGICAVCLPQPGNDYTGQPVIATGWGLTSENGPVSQTLKEVELYVIDERTCAEKHGRILPSSICAAAPGRDTCIGDSGGPLVYKGSHSYILVGVTSTGYGCAHETPGLYTRVEQVLPWIYENTVSCSYCANFFK